MNRSRRNCRFFLQGVCLWDELHNPGYDRARLCVRLASLSGEWDDFLDRAEAFGLTEEEACRIWERRRHPGLTRPDLCPVPFVSGGGDHAGAPLLDCTHLFNTACLLAMPGCPGVCGRYRERE